MSLEQIIALSVGGVILLAIVVYMVLHQRKKVIEWLKYAVAEAERLLGSKTGQLKLHMVYDWFCEKFPVLAAILPFSVFSAWTDTALDVFRKWLETNVHVERYIKEGENGTLHG